MNCEKCRWLRTVYNTKGIGNWYVYGMCLIGGCDGSQYEPKSKCVDCKGGYCEEECLEDEK